MAASRTETLIQFNSTLFVKPSSAAKKKKKSNKILTKKRSIKKENRVNALKSILTDKLQTLYSAN